ncbi:MAG: hypothetical protein ACI86M_001421 [Saprospiraceae bacterium]|jgi:hypothetical protein
MLTNWPCAIIIRIIAFLVLLCTTVEVYCQKTPLPDEVVLTYITRNKPLSTVLKELDRKSGVRINFTSKRIPANKKISINAVNQPLGIILKAILRHARCRYDITGGAIVVSRVKLGERDRDLTISGYLTDEKSGEQLIGANVYLFDKSKGTQTNEHGFYSFTMNKGTKRIYYSYLGYRQEVKEIFLQKDTIIGIELRPDVVLNQIIILDDVENQEEPQAISVSKLNLDRIRTSSSLGGETDIIRLVGLMPGVDGGADGVGGMNVRGGSADQNLVLYDGVPIYNVNHAIGLFSVFNSNIIKNANLIKGNIPARYGGRLSSVLDVRIRDGNTKKFSGNVSLSLLAMKASFEGPIGRKGSSFIVSARRTLLDPWIKGITEYQNENAGSTGFSTYSFLDLNGKLSLKLNKKHTLYINGFYGKDDFNTNKRSRKSDETSVATNTIDTETDWDWGSNVASLRLVSQFNKKVFGRLTTYYTSYSFDSFEKDVFTRDSLSSSRRVFKAGYFKSAITDLAVKYDFDYIPNPSHTLRTGVGATHHRFNPGLVSINNSDNIFSPDEPVDKIRVQLEINEPQLNGVEYFGYVEDEISIGYANTLNIGLHVNYANTGEKSYLSLQPRISFLAKWDNSYFKVGVSRMNQYLHLLSSNGLGLPTDVWLPSTDNIAPEKLWMASMGVGYYNSSGIRFGIEGYFKLFDDLTTFDEGGISTISADTNWESNVPVGTGKAYGIETNIDKIIGRTTWNANYTLAFAFRDFEGLTTDGEQFPFRYNRRHNIKLGFLHKITDNTEFNLNWNLSSGNPITSPSGITGLVNEVITPLFLNKNAGLLPTYNRVDIGFNFYSKYKWGRSKLFLGVYNAFNKANPFYQDVENSVDNPQRFDVVQYSILPIIPSFGYSVSF